MTSRTEREKNNQVDILLVDDSEEQVRLLLHTFKGAGYIVDFALNGVEALNKIRMLQPRLIISDVMMPEMDGFEFCREVKEDPAFKEIPVILLTGLMDPQNLVRGLHSGADYFITKPYNKDSLLSRISKILGEKIMSDGDNPLGDLKVNYEGNDYLISQNRRQIYNQLLSTYENYVQLYKWALGSELKIKKLNQRLQNCEIENKNRSKAS